MSTAATIPEANVRGTPIAAAMWLVAALQAAFDAMIAPTRSMSTTGSGRASMSVPRSPQEPPDITVAVEAPHSSYDVHVVSPLARWETLVGLGCTDVERGGFTHTAVAAELVLHDVHQSVREAVDKDRLRDDPPLDRLPPEPRIRMRAMAAPDAQDALRRAMLFAAERLDRLNDAATAIYRRGRVRASVTFALFTGWHMVLAHIGQTQVYFIRGASVERLTAPRLLRACVEDPELDMAEAFSRMYGGKPSVEAVEATAERFGDGPDLHPELSLRALQPGDRILFDGSALLHHDDILAAAGPAQELRAAARELAAQGSARTVMLAHVAER